MKRCLSDRRFQMALKNSQIQTEDQFRCKAVVSHYLNPFLCRYKTVQSLCPAIASAACTNLSSIHCLPDMCMTQSRIMSRLMSMSQWYVYAEQHITAARHPPRRLVLAAAADVMGLMETATLEAGGIRVWVVRDSGLQKYEMVSPNF